VQTQIAYQPNTSQGTVYNTTFTLNALGQMTSAYIADGKPRSVSFTLDEIGQIIRRDESGYISGQTGNPHEIWYRFSGRQMGYTGNNGTSDLSYDASVGDRRVVGPNSPGTFRNSQVYGGAYADFAQNYDPINSYYQGAAGGSYRVNQGDTLQRIAQSLYGDSSLWYKIAEANGLSAAAALVEGQTLVLPTGVLNAKNNAGTFKPYNAGEAIGDLSPSTPQPPKKPKCGVFGQILLAVIAIAVTALTYGALGGTALSAWAAVGAGAVAGAAGSIASQAVGVATGIQDKFSFKGVALAAIGGAIGGGLGPKGLFGANGAFGNIGSQFVGDALRGAVGSALTQGVGVATGLQDKFSWAGVAAAGIGAGIGGAVGRALTSPGGLFGVSASAGSFGYRMATSAASGIANAATRSAINGESFGKNLIAALPDIIGQAVGGALAGGGQRLMEGGAQELADALSSGVIPAEDAERLSRLAKRLGVEKVFTALSAGGDGNDGKFSFVFTTELQRAGAEKARADFRARGLGEDAATAAYYDVGRLIYLKEQVQGLSVGTQSSRLRMH
jgi:hypothetical protein